MKWRWLHEAVILAVHEQQIAEHGGSPGIRDRALLQSALARPKNRAAYGKADAAALAAAYAYGIARNHPFVDGNKRVAFVAAELFLELNGRSLGSDDLQCVTTFLELAEGLVSEKVLARWIRANLEAP